MRTPKSLIKIQNISFLNYILEAYSFVPTLYTACISIYICVRMKTILYKMHLGYVHNTLQKTYSWVETRNTILLEQ